MSKGVVGPRLLDSSYQQSSRQRKPQGLCDGEAVELGDGGAKHQGQVLHLPAPTPPVTTTTTTLVTNETQTEAPHCRGWGAGGTEGAYGMGVEGREVVAFRVPHGREGRGDEV
jgi:hypothetical protein